MQEHKYMGFRADAHDQKRVETLQRVTGLSTSEILRQLLRTAKVAEVRSVVPVSEELPRRAEE